MKQLIQLISVALIAVLPVVLLPVPADADQVPPEQRVIVSGSSEGGITGNNINVFSLSLARAPVGTTITGQMSSCGRPIDLSFEGRTATVSDASKASAVFLLLGDNQNLPTQYPSDGDHTFSGLSSRVFLSDLVGPTWDYDLTITEPGYDPYDLTGTQSVYDVHRPSCDSINRTYRRTIRVTRWSTLKGKPHIGHTVKATRPVTAGPSRISYKWTYGKKVLSRRSHLYLDPALRGKYIEVIVTIRQHSHTTQRETLAPPHGVR